jgi:predicted flap endonuclease-1-like 5' DNA nuclease
MNDRNKFDLPFVLFMSTAASILGFIAGTIFGSQSTVPEKIFKRVDDESESFKTKARETKEKARDIIRERKASIAKKFDPEAAKIVFEKNIKENDLKLIEGIGPKIEEILKEKGIDTWKKLADAKPKIISEYLLEIGGERYRIHKPDSWPEQAKLALENKWKELKRLQDTLKS